MKENLNQKIKEILSRGVEEIIDRTNLKKRLFSGERLRIKHGIDPTGPKIHLGRAVQLLKLKDFQELGHQIVLIIGDFTAQIGDASDKEAMRPFLSEEKIKENMKDYTKQMERILDMKKVELHYNSQWLKKIKIQDLLNLARRFTAQQMIQRRNFKERWEKGKPIGLQELIYPLLQGFDSVAIKADVELGGFDQLFNLKVGREIQKIFGQKSQDIITLKMLLGLDGRKMSTSWGNVINILDRPEEQFGKIMSMKDELILDYIELATRIPLAEVKKLPPRQAKAKLAREIVRIYHGEKAAAKAEEEFNRIFREKKLPSQILKWKVEEKSLKVLDLLTKIKIVSSKSAGKRLIIQGGVKIDGQPVKNWQAIIKIKKGMVVQVGKRKFIKLV